VLTVESLGMLWSVRLVFGDIGSGELGEGFGGNDSSVSVSVRGGKCCIVCAACEDTE
jgi:hypothetical protein